MKCEYKLKCNLYIENICNNYQHCILRNAQQMFQKKDKPTLEDTVRNQGVKLFSFHDYAESARFEEYKRPGGDFGGIDGNSGKEV